jgi:FkbM family methyltransferase
MKKDTKIGFIITYYHNSSEGLELLKENLSILSREDYYLIIASHSPLDVELQNSCDYYIYQSKNIVDDRKYSHGVAESNLIELSLNHLRDLGIEWTYKVTYDIEINDVLEFKKWDKRDFDFVSCNWGNNIVCTNSFFSNVKFLLDNIRFYHSIEDMFSVNNVLENCWEHDIVSKNLVDRIYSFTDKQTFYGVNKIDKLFYDYNQFQFWYSPEEKRFYIKNSSETDKFHIRIFDYYTDICVYIDREFELHQGVTYFIVPPFNKNLPKSKNGFYLEVYLPDRTIVKNILIKDFDWKHTLSKKFKKIKDLEVKFNEFSDFDDLSIYNLFGFDISEIKNYVDVGACYGMASVPMIERGIKTYMVEADIDNVQVLKRMWSKNSTIKIIDKAVSKIDGDIDFWIQPGIGSVVSSIYSDDVFNGENSRKKIQIPSISPNTLIESYIDEGSIDLMKVDIEGAEYDFFESITDENLKKVKRFIIEFHRNENYKVMNIITKLTGNDFRFKLSKWSEDCGDYIIENKMGVIYAEKLEL